MWLRRRKDADDGPSAATRRGRGRRGAPEHARPGNTVAVLLGVALSHDEEAIGPLAPLGRDALVMWAVRSASAASSRLVLALADDEDTTAWRSALGPLGRPVHGAPSGFAGLSVPGGGRAGRGAGRGKGALGFDVLSVAADASLVEGLGAVVGKIRGGRDAFVLAVDPAMPLVPPDVHLALLDAVGDRDAAAFRLRGDRVALPSVWRVSALRRVLFDDVSGASRVSGPSLADALDGCDAVAVGDDALSELSVDGSGFLRVVDEATRSRAKMWLEDRGVTFAPGASD